jgi:hypothetical protein
LILDIEDGSVGEEINSKPFIWTSPSLKGSLNDPIIFEFIAP